MTDEQAPFDQGRSMTPFYDPKERSDKMWLDSRTGELSRGLGQASTAILQIAQNWTEGHCVSRLVLDRSPQEYVLRVIGKTFRNPREIIVPLLEQSDWSQHQIAAIAGVGDGVVTRVVRELATSPNGEVQRPDKTLGADGKYRPARLVEVMVPDSDVHKPEPVVWADAWTRLVAAAQELDKYLAGRHPIVSDYTHREWQRIDTEVNIVGRVLLGFQRREQAAIAATEGDSDAHQEQTG